jgi:hypothetical protein
MKTLFSLLTIACASFVCAADLYYGSFTFLSGKDANGVDILPVCYRYTEDFLEPGMTPSTVNEPLAKNEILRVCIVRDKRGTNVSYNTPPAVAVDAAGQLVCAECGTVNFAAHDSTCAGNATGAKWLDLNWTVFGTTTSVTAEYATVGDVLGVPANFLANVGSYKQYGFQVSTDTDVEKADGKAYKVYMYLVAMDTRTGAGTCEGQPKHVKAYAMAICYGTASQTYVEASPASPRAWLVNAADGKSIFTPSPGRELAWQPSAEIKSLVVDGKTLTEDALIAYLTPSVSEMTTSENTLSLTANAPDVVYYTLYTKASLDASEWTSFEEFVNVSEKFVDKTVGKRYTRFRIDGKSLSIPRAYGETSRFYMLRGE